jgi:hypothetical protein
MNFMISCFRKILAEAGEFVESGHLEEACDDLVLVSGAVCNTLAKSFSNLLPNIITGRNTTNVNGHD